jgi:transposase-like protein
MAKSATTLTDVKEQVWIQSFGAVLVGLGIFAVAGILFYFMQFWMPREILGAARIVVGLAMLTGIGICGVALYSGALTNRMKAVSMPCPYCDREMQFPTAPTEDFDCEFCNRTVHFENGKPIPVQIVVCRACRAEHRVAINVQRYTCDKCNRPLQLAWVRDTRQVGISDTAEDAMLQNYDVMLVAYDRRRENELAFKIQNLMVTNLNEARRLMGTVSSQTPLVVGYDLPQRKAEAIRRQLQELGATATMRPTRTGTAAPARR